MLLACETTEEEKQYNKKKRAYGKKYRESHPGFSRNNNLLYKFNISLVQYDRMLAEQNGCCAICGRHQSEFKTALAVDHNHQTGEIRGLLCRSCNSGIGYLVVDKHNIDLLISAISYLKNNDKDVI